MDIQIIWDLEDDPDGNVRHVAEHDLTPAEVDEVLHNHSHEAVRSRTTGRPVAIGWTSTGRHIAVVFDWVSDDPPAVYPRTAYDVPPPAEPKKRRKRR